MDETYLGHMDAAYPSPSHPTVLDVGRRKRKAIRDLKLGSGPLADEVREALQKVVAQRQATGKHFLPLVIVYRKRPRRRRSLVRNILRRL